MIPALSSMTEKVAVNKGIKIHYRIVRREGIPLVFLHGGGGSLSAWDIIISLFNNHSNTMIFIDLRGHGLSDKPSKISDYFLERHAEDIRQVIKKEKLNRVILIGHCLGSMIAATYTSLYPQKVEKLILINTGFGMPWFLNLPIIREFTRLAALLTAGLTRFDLNHRGRVNYFPYQGSADIDFRRFIGDLNMMGLGAASRQFLAVYDWKGKKYLPQIKVPVLVIAGTKDSFFPKRDAEKTVNLLPIAKLEYTESNHISIINSPRQVYERIRKFAGVQI